ncbi:proline--tRNA ligase [Buchnera aphidicola]|uniref:proline--tRNA ligase n=1 Tax=Buchnera aphidicola TaxID=9 RepID=UPI0031B864DA
MRTSEYPLNTIKNISNNINSISHKLMIKAGLIRSISSGIYIWLPLGLKVIKKIKKIIRYEMKKIGSIEMYFPIMQPEYLWKKSDRIKKYGNELIKIKDRNKKIFILSPTHEEMVTEFIKQEMTSYKKFPLILYQIQTKFRDEIRPRFGVIRSKEFIMKDAYSFHENKDSLSKTYKKMYQTYMKIFKKMNLIVYPVQAESGVIGGKVSHEFQALSKNGEDAIIIASKNIQQSKNIINKIQKAKKTTIFQKKEYLNIKNIYNKNNYQMKKIFLIIKKNIIKIFIIKNDKKKNNFIIFMIKGDQILNEEKIKTILNLNQENEKINFLNYHEINTIIKKNKKINFKKKIIINQDIVFLKHIFPIVIINNIFFKNHILNQDFLFSKIKNIVINKNKNKKYKIKKSIEIGHIFQIGKKYSNYFNLKLKNKNGINKTIHMGCYGIGVTRLISAIIEQNHDKRGIIWTNEIAPFHAAIIPINFHKCKKTVKISEILYEELKQKGISVLLENRKKNIGEKLYDINLIGIPNIIIINHETLKSNLIEYQKRKEIQKKKLIPINQIADIIKKNIYNKII